MVDFFVIRKVVLSSILLFLFSCAHNDVSELNIDYRDEMRTFVINLSAYAKSQDSDFVIIPQNGIELVTLNGEDDGTVSGDYMNAINGHGQEDLFYGYNNDDEASPVEDVEYIKSFLNISKGQGNVILVTDYCSTHTKMDDSYAVNNAEGYISFAADQRGLNDIPIYPGTPYNENSSDINTLGAVQNFLYLINPENYATKGDFISAVSATNYDLLIMDLFFNDGSEFSDSEISQLKLKANGGLRMVVCYMSIGEAEDYRYYWESSWDLNPPDWLCDENPDWEGNFKVKYWDTEWQSIIYGNNSSYLKKILNAGFDGAYLDIIDAFEYFETI